MTDQEPIDFDSPNLSDRLPEGTMIVVCHGSKVSLHGNADHLSVYQLGRALGLLANSIEWHIQAIREHVRSAGKETAQFDSGVVEGRKSQAVDESGNIVTGKKR